MKHFLIDSNDFLNGNQRRPGYALIAVAIRSYLLHLWTIYDIQDVVDGNCFKSLGEELTVSENTLTLDMIPPQFKRVSDDLMLTIISMFAHPVPFPPERQDLSHDCICVLQKIKTTKIRNIVDYVSGGIINTSCALIRYVLCS